MIKQNYDIYEFNENKKEDKKYDIAAIVQNCSVVKYSRVEKWSLQQDK
jgi:hypothetical protein